MKKNTLVMKFGGAAVATPERFSEIAAIILKRRQHFPRIVIVVSAMADTTDRLIRLAHRVNPQPPQREYDMLVSVGERISISLLAMALAAQNQMAVSFTGSQSGIITSSRHSDAEIIEVKPFRLIPHLDEEKVVIVAGFQGVSQEKEITTLGRGGSDTTAVALGVALDASHVEFYKDVPGICDVDPKLGVPYRLLSELDYDQALEIVSKGSGVLHSRCIHLAKKNNISLHVRSFNNPEAAGTMIHNPELERLSTPLYEEHLAHLRSLNNSIP